MLQAAYIKALRIFISLQAAWNGYISASCEGLPRNDGSAHGNGAGMAIISVVPRGGSASCFAVYEVEVDAVDDAAGLVVYDCKVKTFALDHAVGAVYDDTEAVFV